MHEVCRHQINKGFIFYIKNAEMRLKFAVWLPSNLDANIITTSFQIVHKTEQHFSCKPNLNHRAFKRDDFGARLGREQRQLPTMAW